MRQRAVSFTEPMPHVTGCLALPAGSLLRCGAFGCRDVKARFQLYLANDHSQEVPIHRL